LQAGKYGGERKQAIGPFKKGGVLGRKVPRNNDCGLVAKKTGYRGLGWKWGDKKVRVGNVKEKGGAAPISKGT